MFPNCFLEELWLTILLTMIGRLCISSGWQILYLWCLEMFPTSNRMTLLQAVQISGNVGATVGVLMIDLVSWCV